MVAIEILETLSSSRIPCIKYVRVRVGSYRVIGLGLGLGVGLGLGLGSIFRVASTTSYLHRHGLAQLAALLLVRLRLKEFLLYVIHIEITELYINVRVDR